MTTLSKMPRIYSLTLYGSLLLLSACGGEQYKSSALHAELIQRSCIDSNNNNRCEQTELDNFSTESENKKSTSVISNSAATNLLTTNLSITQTPSVQSTTRILETVNSLTGEQTLVLKAPSSSQQTDALTTLLWHEIHHNPFINNEQQSKNYLTQKLGIAWPQNNVIPAAYTQQENIARQHIINAQTDAAQTHHDIDSAISAVIEAMILNRTLDSAADFSLVQYQQLPLALKGHFHSATPILTWSYSHNRQELAVAHPGRKIEFLSLDNNGNIYQSKQLSIRSGAESTTAQTSAQPLQLLATQNISAQAIDAFASATTAAPAPAPMPPAQPTNPGTGTDTPSQEPRNLIPAGDISSLYFNADNRTGLLLTYDKTQSQSAARACNQSIINYGIFKFDHYLNNNNEIPVISACSQHSLSKITVSADENSILTWDQVAKRLYIIDAKTMREASSYYLQLNSSLLKMELSPNAEYAFIAEEEGRRSYIVRIADMQVMIDFSFSGNQVEDVQWLADGNHLFIASHNEWQLWDTRLAYNPKLLNNGELASSLNNADTITINEDASLIASINNTVLSIHRLADNQLLTQYNNVESMQWNGNKIFASDNNIIKILSLNASVSTPIQAANMLLTNSYIAADNASLTTITSALTLPKNVAELSSIERSDYTNLAIVWSTSSSLENSIDNTGNIVASNRDKHGVLTATINGYFRGDAIRWTKDFDITIKAK